MLWFPSYQWETGPESHTNWPQFGLGIQTLSSCTFWDTRLPPQGRDVHKQGSHFSLMFHKNYFLSLTYIPCHLTAQVVRIQHLADPEIPHREPSLVTFPHPLTGLPKKPMTCWAGLTPSPATAITSAVVAGPSVSAATASSGLKPHLYFFALGY